MATRVAEPPPELREPLPPDGFRWICQPSAFRFETTAEVEPIFRIIGQEPAVEALKFGLETRAPGHNIFIRGVAGTGRAGLVRQMLETTRMSCRPARDRCYVHDFSAPERPALVTLPTGQGPAFRRAVDRLARFVRDALGRSLESDGLRAEKAALDRQGELLTGRIVKPFEVALGAEGLALVSVPMGPFGKPDIVPLVGGGPLPPEALVQAVAAGMMTPAGLDQFQCARAARLAELERIAERVQEVRRAQDESLRELFDRHVRSALAPQIAEIARTFDTPAVRRFLDQVVEDVVEHRRWSGVREAAWGPEEDFMRLYAVNVVLAHEEGEAECPVIIESAPTVPSLLGRVGRGAGVDWYEREGHASIGGGSLLRADGGFLVLEAREILADPAAWKVLLRTIKTGRLDLTPPDPFPVRPIAPEPIDVDIKVILIGDPEVFRLLDTTDPDFPHLFKVLVDLVETIPRDQEGLALYAGVLARIVKTEGLLPFDRAAVAVLTEHGARIAAHRGKLTARFGRLADIAREASWLAAKDLAEVVSAAHVLEAVRAGKRRASLPSRQFREGIADGTLHVQATGQAVGQINGLAVVQAGALTYGFPARITATIGAGSSGVINIDREAALSGSAHTKAFLLLGGVLRALLQTDHPLAFNASIAFEQTPGGIDGDSASGAEVCCLLSALTGIPLRQDIAMTGAIDQMGNILAVGAVNEKIEGFFDSFSGLAGVGRLGVIIPASNAGDLMLRDDMLEAARRRRLRIWAVTTVQEALEILTGVPAGVRTPKGSYPEGSLLALAIKQAREYWIRSLQVSDRPTGARA